MASPSITTSRASWIVPSIVAWLVTKAWIAAVTVLSHRESLANGTSSFSQLWARQEFLWYADIAETGYVGTGEFAFNTAYFPGTAMVMRSGLQLGIDPALSGMVVAATASLIATMALARMAHWYGGTPSWTATAWLVAPTAVFLVAPWSEALFAAFAFWAWVAARESRWLIASLLAGLATYVRINGLFLAVALLVLFLVTERRVWRRAVWLVIPFLVVAAHFAYLRTVTGSWTAWRDSMADHFNRGFADPATSLMNTVTLVTSYVPGTFSTRFLLELAAAGVMTIFVVILAGRRLWADATYVAVTEASLITANFYQAMPRTLVLLFPIWLVLGAWLSHSKVLRWAYLAAAIPLTTVTVVLFTQGQWVG